MKNRFFLISLFILPLLAWAIPGSAQERPIAFTGATIYPIEQAPIENGVLLIEGGVITAVGDSKTRIPRNALISDVSGKVILPGLVDTHSHIGGVMVGTDHLPRTQMSVLWTLLTLFPHLLKRLYPAALRRPTLCQGLDC